MANRHFNHLETILTDEQMPIRFFKSVDHGSYVPYHYHNALEIILILKGEIFVTTPPQASSIACTSSHMSLKFNHLYHELMAQGDSKSEDGKGVGIAVAKALGKEGAGSDDAKSDLITPSSQLSLANIHIPADDRDQHRYEVDALKNNLILINCDELHASGCTTFNEAYVLQIPQSFLEESWGVRYDFPLRFDLRLLSDSDLAKFSSAFCDLIESYELYQGALGYKARLLHALYGLMVVLLNAQIPLPYKAGMTVSARANTINGMGAVSAAAANLAAAKDKAAQNNSPDDEFSSSSSSANTDDDHNQSVNQQSKARGSVKGKNKLNTLEDLVPQEDQDGLDNYEDKDDGQVQMDIVSQNASEHYRRMNLQRLQPVLDYIKIHYKENIKLEDMADITHLHPRYFCRVFKEAIGMSLLSYVSELRLCHVYHDLTEEKTPISTLITRHGFSNSKIFYKAFKDRFSLTPKQVRAMLVSRNDVSPRSYSYFERYSSEFNRVDSFDDHGVEQAVVPMTVSEEQSKKRKVKARSKTSAVKSAASKQKSAAKTAEAKQANKAAKAVKSAKASKK